MQAEPWPSRAGSPQPQGSRGIDAICDGLAGHGQHRGGEIAAAAAVRSEMVAVNPAAAAMAGRCGFRPGAARTERGLNGGDRVARDGGTCRGDALSSPASGS
jgi:hypothetical protein